MMRKLLSRLKSVSIVTYISLVALVAVLGVGAFDTYPTYWKRDVTLSEVECSQVAVLVAAHVFKEQTPDQPLPDKVIAELNKSTRLAKRVAKYIIEKGMYPAGAPAGYIYQGLLGACLQAGGDASLR